MLRRFFCGLVTAAMIFSSHGAQAARMNLTLDEAIDLALKNNRLIEQSSEAREAAKWALSAVRRNSGLVLSWSSTLNHIGGRAYHSQRANHDFATYAARHGLTDSNGNKFNPNLYPSYDNEMYNNFSLRMNLYSGGRLENQRKAARYSLNAADMTLENSRQQVKYQTAAAYYQVLLRAEYVKVQQQAVELLEEHLRNVEIQYEVGTVAKSDMLATSVQLANVRQALNTAEGNYLTAISQLNNLMGVAVDTEIEIGDEVNFAPYTLTEEACLQYALEHRPDGVAAKYAVKQATAAKNSAKSGYRPNVSALAQGIFGGEGNFKADHYPERWAVGLELSWNIFDNGITSAQVEQAKAVERQAQSQALSQLETIQLEVHSAYIGLQIAERNIAVASEAVAKAEEEFAIAKIRYIEGVDTNLNVMNSQEKVVETRNNFYTALFNYNTSRAQLEKAMGVPVATDAERYVVAEQEGNSSARSLKFAQVTQSDTAETDKPFAEDK